MASSSLRFAKHGLHVARLFPLPFFSLSVLGLKAVTLDDGFRFRVIAAIAVCILERHVELRRARLRRW